MLLLYTHTHCLGSPVGSLRSCLFLSFLLMYEYVCVLFSCGLVILLSMFARGRGIERVCVREAAWCDCRVTKRSSAMTRVCVRAPAVGQRRFKRQSLLESVGDLGRPSVDTHPFHTVGDSGHPVHDHESHPVPQRARIRSGLLSCLLTFPYSLPFF